MTEIEVRHPLGNETLRDLVYGWADGSKVCDMADCPHATYCLECHVAAWNALTEIKRRVVFAMIGLVR